MIPHTRTILRPSTPYHNHAVLLYVMAFTGNISTDNPPTAQPDLGRLALAGIGFLRLGDADFETDAFHLGAADHCWGEGAALFLRAAAPIADLVQGCEVGWCG